MESEKEQRKEDHTKSSGSRAAVRVMLCLLPPLCLLLLLLFRSNMIALATRFPVCAFHAITGLDCPACGNTRSVLALLRGDLLTALRNNIVPPLLVLAGLLGYGELVLWCLGRHRALLPRNGIFWIVFGGILFTYFILRNLIPGLLV